MKKIAIIGAGPGGLAAGMILSHLGHQVTIYEKDDRVGGRSKALMIGNFEFDAGPTFLMYTEILEDVFKASGYDLQQELELIPIDPLYRLVFPNVTWEPSMNESKNIEMYNAYREGLGESYLTWKKQQKKKLEVIAPLLKRPFRHVFDYVRMDTLKALPKLHPFQSVYSSLKKINDTPEFIHSLSFQAKYLGMASYSAPSAFTFLPYLEHEFGLYHIKGGLNQINEKMASLFKKNGGLLHLNSQVEKILVENKKAYGLMVNGKEVLFDDVIINADFSYAMSHLIDQKHLKKWNSKKLEKKNYSVSTMNLYLCLDKVFDFEHHQIVFSENYDQYLSQLLNGEFTDDLSYYIHNPVVLDEAMAPKGKSALYILAPIPNLRSEKDWDTYQGEVEELIYTSIKKRLGIDLKPHIIEKKVITPKEWEQDYNVYIGAVFNLSHRLSQMMHLRPHNQFEEIKHLYLVGGGTHPGSGLPTIYQSALLLKKYFKEKDDVK